MTYEIRGAEQFERLAKNLKGGPKDLSRELSKAISSATKPIKQAISKSALDTLPSRGGLALRASKAKTATRRRTAPNGAGIRVVATEKKLSTWHLNQGIVRHRVNGKPPDQWTVQHTTPGYWDDAVEAAGPHAKRELVQAMERVSRRLEANR